MNLDELKAKAEAANRCGMVADCDNRAHFWYRFGEMSARLSDDGGHRDPEAWFVAAASPDVVLALVERVRAAEAAAARVRNSLGAIAAARGSGRYDGEATTLGWLVAIVGDFTDALEGPGEPASVEVAPGATDDLEGAQIRSYGEAARGTE